MLEELLEIAREENQAARCDPERLPMIVSEREALFARLQELPGPCDPEDVAHLVKDINSLDQETEKWIRQGMKRVAGEIEDVRSAKEYRGDYQPSHAKCLDAKV